MERRSKIALAAAWLAVVLPMIPMGYGSFGDCWRVARAAETIWRTGRYSSSRGAVIGVGYPLYELSVAPFVHLGNWILGNLYSTIAGFAILLALFHLERRRRLVHPLLVIVTIAFLPILVKNSTTTIDVIPALAIVLWGYAVLLDGRYLRASFLIGFAAGFRHTSAFFILPAMLYAWRAEGKPGLVFRMGLLAFVAAVVAYSPFYLTYGLVFPHGLEDIDLRSLLVIGGYHALEVFGSVQSVALILVLGVYGLKALRERSPYFRSPEFAFHAVAIAVMLVLFAPNPLKAEYLLPVVPFVVFMMDRLLSRRAFALMAVLLLSYHFVRLDMLGGESGRRSVVLSVKPGFTISEINARRFMLSTRRAATAYVADRPTILMMGASWIPIENDRWVFDPSMKMFRQRRGNLYVGGNVLDEKQLQDLTARGFRLVVWKGGKWEYMRLPTQTWRRYVELEDDLGDFFGVPIEGQAFQTERGFVLWPRGATAEGRH